MPLLHTNRHFTQIFMGQWKNLFNFRNPLNTNKNLMNVNKKNIQHWTTTLGTRFLLSI